MLYSQTIARSKKDNITYFNIMVAGALGSGKTSFVRTLCEVLKSSVIQGTFTESRHKALLHSLRRTEEIYTVSMHIEEDGKRTALSLVDTPGITSYSSMTEQLKTVVNYIDAQYARTFSEESKLRRNTKAMDTQIHACLYFVSPYNQESVSDIDRFALKVLSTRVNVIPIISKADTLSVAQVENLKSTIKEEIFRDYQMRVYGHIDIGESDFKFMDEFSEKASPVSKIIRALEESYTGEDDEEIPVMVDYLKSMPYTMISYEVDINTGRPVQPKTKSTLVTKTIQLNINDSESGDSSKDEILGRLYPWIFVECCNPDNCEFLLIKNMLLSTHIDMLKADTFELFYEKYRTQQLLSSQKIQITVPESQPKRIASS